ncbi:Caffeoyl-CoA O-methyltransferase [Ananas comosus]|uniref:Caffeoyl-CoA O-methyltransferase n=1 Tax=Ananas comosus TaxID=4615 RepID=A0A199V2Q1_ANACO|nr:Caffeoyl-CoA O-methyltransferase [Ananas comosus]
MATITYKPSLEDIPPFLKRICHLSSEALYQYLLETSVYPREHECMKELRDATDKQPLCVQSFIRIFVLLC